jgi:putative Ca2+/H+ antiporter (TMEM165/GDT1 family)
VVAALTAFAVVFLAELGDRTQLLIVGLSTRHRPGPVALGVLLGYLLTTVASVAVGRALGQALPDTAVRLGGGLLFLGFAVWAVLDDEEEDGDEGGGRVRRDGIGLVLSLVGAIVLSEIGDKSMLATATLAAEGDAPVAIAIGALAGIMAAGLLGIVAGRLLAERVPARVLRLAGAALFAVIGVGLVLDALT